MAIPNILTTAGCASNRELPLLGSRHCFRVREQTSTDAVEIIKMAVVAHENVIQGTDVRRAERRSREFSKRRRTRSILAAGWIKGLVRQQLDPPNSSRAIEPPIYVRKSACDAIVRFTLVLALARGGVIVAPPFLAARSQPEQLIVLVVVGRDFSTGIPRFGLM